MDLELVKLSLDNMPLAVSIIDTEGILLYFNRRAAEILDRKPEYTGRNIRECHKKQMSFKKIDKMMQMFEEGREQPFWYEGIRYGRNLRITFTPLRSNGSLTGCLQTVEEMPEKRNESDRLT